MNKNRVAPPSILIGSTGPRHIASRTPAAARLKFVPLPYPPLPRYVSHYTGLRYVGRMWYAFSRNNISRTADANGLIFFFASDCIRLNRPLLFFLFFLNSPVSFLREKNRFEDAIRRKNAKTDCRHTRPLAGVAQTTFFIRSRRSKDIKNVAIIFIWSIYTYIYFTVIRRPSRVYFQESTCVLWRVQNPVGHDDVFLRIQLHVNDGNCRYDLKNKTNDFEFLNQ